MKLILAATDFSRTSRNAVNYAAEMAKRFKSKLILFHSYMPPVIMSDIAVVMPTVTELEKDSLKILKRMATSLKTKYGASLKLELVCKYGMAVDAIKDYAIENKVDLVVMGMKGAGALEEKLVGSITTDVIKKSRTPVLSIGSGVKFRAIKNIVFATDYLEIASPELLAPVKEIATAFKSHIHLLNVVPGSTTVPSVNQAVEGLKTEHAFEAFKHSFHAIVNKNAADGINEFIRLRKIDMVVMIPRKHNIFHALFKGRATKQVAFHTTIPLLSIHN